MTASSGLVHSEMPGDTQVRCGGREGVLDVGYLLYVPGASVRCGNRIGMRVSIRPDVCTAPYLCQNCWELNGI